MDVAETKVVPLTPPPMWEGLDDATLRARWVELVAAAVERYPPPAKVLGPERVLAADPHDRPAKVARRPAPKVHSACAALREAWVEAYGAFVDQYRRALDGLRSRWEEGGFPVEGCRPPCLLWGESG